MKKMLLTSTILICSIAIGLGIYGHQSVAKSSDMIAQNIEAMAQDKYTPNHKGRPQEVEPCDIYIWNEAAGGWMVVGWGTRYSCDFSTLSSCTAGCIE